MPRKRELTWQSGTQGRPGRWRKIFRGRRYYFPAGRGKTDQAAYQAPAAAWVQQKAKIQTEAPSRHHAKYEHEIAKWGEVISWSRQHGELAMAEIATEAVKRLRAKMAAGDPQPPAAADTFDGHFELKIRFPWLSKLFRELDKVAAGIQRDWDTDRSRLAAGQAELPVPILPSSGAADIWNSPTLERSLDDRIRFNFMAPVTVTSGMTVSKAKPTRFIVPSETKPDMREKLQLEKEIWRDRVDVMQRSAPNKEKTLAAQVELYLQTKRHEAEANSVSVGRLHTLRHQLTVFADRLGGGTPVDKISGQVLLDYRTHLLQQVADKKLTKTTASDRLSSVKSFVRWLWQTEAIADLPRILHSRSKSLEIGKSSQKITTFSEFEIAVLLGRASERTRLYILLTLNTAMTQKDMADLTFDEIDWEQGRIVRKRSKTRDSKGAPTVSYKLWPETKDLLWKHRSKKLAGRVLLNARGEPLWQERFTADGRYQKMDNLRNAFDRLRRKTHIDKPFKSLKKPLPRCCERVSNSTVWSDSSSVMPRETSRSAFMRQHHNNC